jgi:hypothetical protein
MIYLKENSMDWKYEDSRIYAVNEKGELLAEATFVLQSDKQLDVDHVYVNPILRGQGVADKIMQEVAKYLREKGIVASASCSYANTWFKKHRDEFADIISDTIDDQSMACKIDAKH